MSDTEKQMLYDITYMWNLKNRTNNASWEIDGETVETVSDFIFWAAKPLQIVTAAMKLKDAYSLESYDQPR